MEGVARTLAHDDCRDQGITGTRHVKIQAKVCTVEVNWHVSGSLDMLGNLACFLTAGAWHGRAFV